MHQIGFDNEKYLKMQAENIYKRIDQFEEKLYLEFGGKLFNDYHASRVLPGFEPDSKIQLLSSLKDITEIVMVVSAEDIAQARVFTDLGITYDKEVLRLIEEFKDRGLFVGSVVVTKYSKQKEVDIFISRIKDLGLTVYTHYFINDYPFNLPYIMSEDGFGKNDYIQTTKPLVVITAPGSGSGKMATCLSQLYHEFKRGVKAGYAKYETFPIWNLPLKHPVNQAYEAATIDLTDTIMIDPFHLEAYGLSAVNYNRDIEVFPILRAIFEQIWGTSPYKSPTDMGVNMAGYCLSNEEACRYAANQEIIRRYFHTVTEQQLYGGLKSQIQRLELLMSTGNISVLDRDVVRAAREKALESQTPSVAIQLPNGEMVTGRTSSLLGASSAALLNSLKQLADIEDSVHLIPPSVIKPIQTLKVDFFKNKNPHLHVNELLIALSICSITDPVAALALEQLPKLEYGEAHSNVILSPVDIEMFMKLGVNITCEPESKYS